MVMVEQPDTLCPICHDQVPIGRKLLLPGCAASLLHAAHVMCLTLWLTTR